MEIEIIYLISVEIELLHRYIYIAMESTSTIESPLYEDNNSNFNSISISNNCSRIEDITYGDDRISIDDIKSRLTMSSSFSHINIQNPVPLTIFLLINTMIGSGILNQPHVFEASGLLGGLIGFIIAGYYFLCSLFIYILSN